MSSIKYTVSAIKVLVPLLSGSPPKARKPKNTMKRCSPLTCPWTISLHTRQSRASGGPNTLENVCSNGHMRPNGWKTQVQITHGLPSTSYGPHEPSWHLLGPFRGNPGNLPELSEGPPGALRSSPEQVTSQPNHWKT